MTDFESRNRRNVANMAADRRFAQATADWIVASVRYEYSYHFRWMGLPVIQYPQDLVAMQEIIWKVRPRLIIETGIARGGSMIFYASMLELLGGGGRVVGIDIDIRSKSRDAIESHPLSKRVELIEGSSTSDAVVAAVRARTKGVSPILVVLDSNHTHEHVLRELELYSPLVTRESYLVVFDTVIEKMSDDLFPDRPWGKGNNPMTAVHEFLKGSDRFEIDREIQDKLQITVAPDGYLRCVKI